MTMRPCVRCGQPSTDTRCPEHVQTPTVRRGSSPRARGYDAAWDRLSRRARRLQPWCLDCGATEGLTADHLPTAWDRKDRGLPLRLADVAVVCGSCNVIRGSSRPGTRRASTHRGYPSGSPARTSDEAISRLQIGPLVAPDVRPLADDVVGGHLLAMEHRTVGLVVPSPEHPKHSQTGGQLVDIEAVVDPPVRAFLPGLRVVEVDLLGEDVGDSGRGPHVHRHAGIVP